MAGRALRAIRTRLGWTQENVARSMAERLGCDFHQTMVAKAESATRPLRVRELAAFASLYGVTVECLVYLPVTDAEREIAELNAEQAEQAAAMERLELATAQASRELEAACRRADGARATLAATVARLAYVRAYSAGTSAGTVSSGASAAA